MTDCRLLVICVVAAAAMAADYPNIPREYLAQPGTVPKFWTTTVDGVHNFLSQQIQKGSVQTIGVSAGKRALRAVFYGHPRQGRGTTTFSGALGASDVRAYLGPDSDKKVFMLIAGVHGAELEGIAGAVNLLAVLETGRDLRGRAWPELTTAAASLDRIIVLPIANPDGRARVPYTMLKHRDEVFDGIQEYFNTGAWADGRPIGWPACKQFIPLDFSKTQFPGGYPNDAGVNIQHDDFFGARQPETQALFDLTARERPDLILNMHTGTPFMKMLRSFIEPALMPAFDALYRRMQTRLTERGLQGSRDASVEADPAREKLGVFNLDTALNLNCGALAALIESPSHAYNVRNRKREIVTHTPDDLLDAQLIACQESMKYLAETGGRVRWTRPR